MHRFFVLRQNDGPIPRSGAGETAGPDSDVKEGVPGPAWPAGAEVTLSETDATHAARVLRLKPGQAVVVCDGRGFDYEGELVRVASQSALVRLGPPEPSRTEPRLFLTLVQGVAKGGKMDFIIQKAVEIGVSRIIPVETERTVVRLKGDKADARVERWQRIAYEAAKQAGRGRIPIVEPVHPWRDVWGRDDLGVVVVPWEDETGSGLMETMRNLVPGGGAKEGADIPRGAIPRGAIPGNTVPRGAHPPITAPRGANSRITAPRGANPRITVPRSATPRITVVIGPEGGLSEEEVELAKQNGARPVSLGPRILRTETAAVVACSLVLAAGGELG